MRSRKLVLLLALACCDPQADSAYPGEPLVTLRGQVKSSGPLGALEAAMLWQHGAPPAITDEDLATRAPVTAGFPSSFTVHLYHPPPAGAQRQLAAGEPVWARSVAAAIPYGIAAEQLAGGAAANPAPNVSDGGVPLGGNPNYGVDANHWVIYLAADVPANSLTEWWLGAPLSKGFHLLRVAAVDPKCVSQAQLDACAASLTARGVPDDGTSNAGTARAFCLAPYRLSPAPPDEELILDLGAVGLGPAGELPVIGVEQLYRSHGHIVLRRARTLLGSEPEAQEALQEVFASLLRTPEILTEARSMVAWLYQATTHWCLNQLRNRRTGARLLEQSAPASPSAPASAETLAEVRSLLSRMPPDVAAAAVYHHLDGMTHAEVAELLGCSRRQVGYLLERARQSPEPAEQSA